VEGKKEGKVKGEEKER